MSSNVHVLWFPLTRSGASLVQELLAKIFSIHRDDIDHRPSLHSVQYGHIAIRALYARHNSLTRHVRIYPRAGTRISFFSPP